VRQFLPAVVKVKNKYENHEEIKDVDEQVVLRDIIENLDDACGEQQDQRYRDDVLYCIIKPALRDRYPLFFYL